MKKREMTQAQSKFFEILEDDSCGIICAPTDATTGCEVLTDYLLPKGWYSASGGSYGQVRTEIIHAILWKYSRQYRKDYTARRKEWSSHER